METRTCQNCKKDFTIEPDDFSFYEKMNVPPPTFCPECRWQRRLVWRNNMSLYNRNCDLCNKPIVSTYSPDSGITQYCNKCWWSDKWDARSFGKDYDFSRTFFEQYKELIYKVPHIAMVNDNNIASIGCEYTYDWWFAKNCYMSFSGWKIENVMYSFFMMAGKDMVDCIAVKNPSGWLYECIDCDSSYNLKYSELSISCVDSQFLYDCRGCTECFMCAGLRNKKYNFKNIQYSKEEYKKIIDGYKLNTFSGIEQAKAEYNEFILSYPRRFATVIHCFNSTGEYLLNCKNSKNAFHLDNAENCKWYDYGSSPKDSQDLSMSGELSECYEGAVVDHSNRNIFGIFTVKSQDVTYTQHCHSSKHLFGCVGMRNSSYCILNKQYDKEEYEILVEKIKKQMNELKYIDKKGRTYAYGENYPIEFSPFGYNETVSGYQFPLTKEEVLDNGYNWGDSLQMTTGKQTITPSQIPETISEVSDQITSEILACSKCSRNYKITPQELVFYRKMDIPIPRVCFYCRHISRMNRRNPSKLWRRSCMCQEETHGHVGKCQEEFETSYSPDRPEIIYCEKCYQKEIN